MPVTPGVELKNIKVYQYYSKDFEEFFYNFNLYLFSSQVIIEVYLIYVSRKQYSQHLNASKGS